MSSEGTQTRPAAFSSDAFRRVCGRFATGVSIASVLDGAGTPRGLTVSSFTSVSLEPPLILICLGHAVTHLEDFRRARYFGISILGHEQRATSERFAQRGHDRFDGVDWRAGETGVPLIAGALATLECAAHQRVTAGDHDILIGEVVRTHVGEGEPLIHYFGRYRRLAGDA